MKKNKQSYQARRQAILGYAFMAPWIIGFLLLTAWPFFYTIYLSFFHVQLMVTGWELRPVRLDNYHLAFFRNIHFVPNLIGFVIMQLTYTPAITVIAFMLALLLNREIKGRGWFRALFFLPVIVMSGPVMNQLMDTGSVGGIGIQGMILLNMVDQFSDLIASVMITLFSNFSTILWFTGIPIILFLSGLQKIDAGILEAARIDSATNWQILWKITIPIIRPIVLVSVILTIVQISSFTTNPVMPMIQESIFDTVGGLGQASAFSWIYAAVILMLIGVAYLILKAPKDEVPPEVKRRAKAWNER